MRMPKSVTVKIFLDDEEVCARTYALDIAINEGVVDDESTDLPARDGGEHDGRGGGIGGVIDTQRLYDTLDARLRAPDGKGQR